MAWVAAAIAAAGAIGGGAMGSKGAEKASKAQTKSAADQLAFQKWLYEQGVQRNTPFYATGVGANNMLAGMFGLPQSPYQAPDFSGGGGYGGGYGGGSNKEKNIFDKGPGKYASGKLLFGTGGLFGPSGYQAPEGTISATDVLKLLKQGHSVKDIRKLAPMSARFDGRAVKKLTKAGLNMDQITRLYAGPSGQNTPQVLNPGDKGYKPFELGDGPPGYNFFRDEGQRNLLGSFGAGGQGAFSGNALKGITQFNQQYANQNLVQPLMQIAGYGQGASGQMQNASNAYGAYGGNAIGAQGDARASGYANQANMWGQALSGAGQAAGYGYNQYQNRQNQWDDYQYYGNQGSGWNGG